MELKSTDELEKILGSTHINNISSYFTENEDSIINNEYAFHDFIRMLIKKKKLKQQDVFLAADIPENTGINYSLGRNTLNRETLFLGYAMPQS